MQASSPSPRRPPARRRPRASRSTTSACLRRSRSSPARRNRRSSTPAFPGALVASPRRCESRASGRRRDVHASCGAPSATLTVPGTAVTDAGGHGRSTRRRTRFGRRLRGRREGRLARDDVQLPAHQHGRRSPRRSRRRPHAAVTQVTKPFATALGATVSDQYGNPSSASRSRSRPTARPRTRASRRRRWSPTRAASRWSPRRRHDHGELQP